MSYSELSGRALASTRVQRTAVWDTVQFALNGVMFVLLGEQLPGIPLRCRSSRAGRQSSQSLVARRLCAGDQLRVGVCAFCVRVGFGESDEISRKPPR